MIFQVFLVFYQLYLLLELDLTYTAYSRVRNRHRAGHRRRKCEHCFPNSLQPISYFGSIWELYVLDLRTKVFCRKDNQLHFPMDKELTVPKQCLQFGQKYPKCLIKFQPNLSAQAQKFLIFEKKNSLWVSVVRGAGKKCRAWKVC